MIRLFMQDLANVEAGIYPFRPITMDLS
jgi:hypothetical protein